MHGEPIAFEAVRARGKDESRTGVGVADAEGLQRVQQKFSGVTLERLVRSVGAGDKLRGSAKRDV